MATTDEKKKKKKPEDYVPPVSQHQAEYDALMQNKPTSIYGDQIRQTLDQILNRQPFEYNMNADTLYHQYKNQYQDQARMAMKDAMGQATALTGGYANSYAQNVGQQAYAQLMEQLNNIIPDLYNLALGQYNQEGTDLLNRYSLMMGADSEAQSKWEAERDRLLALIRADEQIGYDRFMDQVAYDNSDGDILSGLFNTDSGTQYADAVALVTGKTEAEAKAILQEKGYTAEQIVEILSIAGII